MDRLEDLFHLHAVAAANELRTAVQAALSQVEREDRACNTVIKYTHLVVDVIEVELNQRLHEKIRSETRNAVVRVFDAAFKDRLVPD